LPEQANFGRGKEGMQRTCKVASYQPNRLGLYDMHGNVAEWCDDIQKANEAEVKELGVTEGRVIRSGAWMVSAASCTAAHRDWYPEKGSHPYGRRHFLGLRLARVRPLSAVTAADADRRAAAEEQARAILKQLDAKFEEDLSVPGKPIKAINLDGKNVSDEGLGLICAGTPRLETLSLLHASVTKAGLVHVAKLPHLKELILGHSKTSEADIAPLAESKSLKSLRMRFGGQPHYPTGETVKLLKNLELLELGHSLMDDKAVQQIATLQGLRSLTLAFSPNITDAGVAHLKALTKLEYLDFYATTKLTDKSLEELKVLPNLKDLHLEGSKVTPAGVEAYKTAVPGCRVHVGPAQ
jgi:hypothetical protein